MIIHAVKGNAAYMKEIFDRNDGKLPDAEPPAAVDVDAAAATLDQFVDSDPKPNSEPSPEVQE
jgi:hypothetical protein